MILDESNGPHEVLEHRHVVWPVLRVSPEENVRRRWFKVAYLVDQSKYQGMKEKKKKTEIRLKSIDHILCPLDYGIQSILKSLNRVPTITVQRVLPCYRISTKDDRYPQWDSITGTR